MLKDNQELRSAFIKNELDENSHEAFSESVQMHYTQSKKAGIHLLDKLLKILWKLYEEKKGYLQLMYFIQNWRQLEDSKCLNENLGSCVMIALKRVITSLMFVYSGFSLVYLRR